MGIIRNNQMLWRQRWHRLAGTLMVVVMLMTSFGVSQPVLAQTTTTNTMRLRVESATDATQVTSFKYIINIDNTGTTTQRSPADGCIPGAAGLSRLLSVGLGGRRGQYQPDLYPGR